MESTTKKEPAPSSPNQPMLPPSASDQNAPYLQGPAQSYFQPKASSTEPFLPPPYSPTSNVMIIQQPQNQRPSWKNSKIVIVLICSIVATVILIKTIYYIVMQR